MDQSVHSLAIGPSLQDGGRAFCQSLQLMTTLVSVYLALLQTLRASFVS